MGSWCPFIFSWNWGRNPIYYVYAEKFGSLYSWICNISDADTASTCRQYRACNLLCLLKLSNFIHWTLEVYPSDCPPSLTLAQRWKQYLASEISHFHMGIEVLMALSTKICHTMCCVVQYWHSEEPSASRHGITLFHCEDGGYSFIRNVSDILAEYIASHPRS
jgi:hypothetical protein